MNIQSVHIIELTYNIMLCDLIIFINIKSPPMVYTYCIENEVLPEHHVLFCRRLVPYTFLDQRGSSASQQSHLSCRSQIRRTHLNMLQFI